MIYIIVAVDQNNGIGKDGKMPWHFSKELQHFSEITKETINPDKQNLVIMGRTTWESLPPKFRPLPGRKNVVLTGQNIEFEGAATAHSLEEALNLATPDQDLFVIGGAQVFTQALTLPNLAGIYLTRIHHSYDCDTFFPEVPAEFSHRHHLGSDQENGIQFDYYLLER